MSLRVSAVEDSRGQRRNVSGIVWLESMLANESRVAKIRDEGAIGNVDLDP